MRKTRVHFASALASVVALAACAPAIRTVPARTTRVVVVSDDEDRSQLRVPPGHLPGPGKCRVWIPGRPPGHQPRAAHCNGIERTAPAGSWILYRPASDRKVVHARVIDPKRAGVVVVVRVYDADRGTYLGQERRR